MWRLNPSYESSSLESKSGQLSCPESPLSGTSSVLAGIRFRSFHSDEGSDTNSESAVSENDFQSNVESTARPKVLMEQKAPPAQPTENSGTVVEFIMDEMIMKQVLRESKSDNVKGVRNNTAMPGTSKLGFRIFCGPDYSYRTLLMLVSSKICRSARKKIGRILDRYHLHHHRSEQQE